MAEKKEDLYSGLASLNWLSIARSGKKSSTADARDRSTLVDIIAAKETPHIN